jgi:hypothetical protein
MAIQFSRFNNLMAAIVSAISAGMGDYQVQQMRSSYKSRGHGIGKNSGKTWRLTNAPNGQLSNARQNARISRKFFMAKVNGFELMQQV